MQNISEASEKTLRPGDIPPTVCPVCERYCEDELHPIDALHESLRHIVRSNAATPEAEHLCRRCLELFKRAKRQIESHASVFEQNDFVLPTPLRMDADERFRGRGVTMAFIAASPRKPISCS